MFLCDTRTYLFLYVSNLYSLILPEQRYVRLCRFHIDLCHRRLLPVDRLHALVGVRRAPPGGQRRVSVHERGEPVQDVAGGAGTQAQSYVMIDSLVQRSIFGNG